MKAIILCAGYSTRMHPLTYNKPKSLLPVSGKPILNYIIRKIEKCEDIDKVLIVTNDKFYAQFVIWYNQYKKDFDKKIEIINDGTTSDETKLGGIGDLWFVIEKKKIDDDILVVLGDNLFDFDLQEMINFFKNHDKCVMGIYNVTDLKEAKRFGVVEVKDNKILLFEEKPESPKSTLASIGIYLYKKEDLKKIGEYMKTDGLKDAPGHLIPYLISLDEVYAFEFSGSWYDIGTPETYEKIKDTWK